MGSLLAFDLGSRKVRGANDVEMGALFSDLATDTLYAVVEEDIVPMFDLEAEHETAVWRSGKLVDDTLPSFAWLWIEGVFESAVVRLYGDGALFYTTPAITDNEPVRLPARRFRELEVEVECADRIAAVVLASSSGELRHAWRMNGQ